MKQIDKKLLEHCRENPERPYTVIVTMSRDRPFAKIISDVGVVQYSEIGPGIFTARVSGVTVLKLCERDDIDEIIEDFQVEAC